MNRSIKVTVLLLLIVFWMLWNPGTKVATDFIYWYPQELISAFNFPQLWRNTLGADGMGYNVVSTAWAWPIIFLLAFLTKVGLSFSFLSRIVFIIPFIILSSYSIAKFLSYFGVRKYGITVGSFVFLLNTYVLLLIDGGQLFISLAYAVFPMVSVLFIKLINDYSLGSVLKFTFFLITLSIFDLRIVFLFVFFAVIYFFYGFLVLKKEKKFILIKNAFFIAVLSFIFLTGFHFYWIYPSLKTGVGVIPESYLKSLSGDFQTYTSLSHALYLFQPHWYKNVFGKLEHVSPIFVLLPVFAFSAPILRKKDKNIGFYLVVAILSLFLAKGANPPFASLYPWIIDNVPGFLLFRDPTKFFFLIVLSYSFLIGVAVDELTKKFNWSLVISRWSFKTIPLFFTFYLLLLIFPVYTGKMTGLFSNPVYQKEHKEVNNFLERDIGFGRVLWIPGSTPLAFSSPLHPQALGYLISEKRPFAVARVGSYEQHNYLRESTFMGELLDIAAVGYIAYPYPDVRKEELKQDSIDYYYTFLNQLTDLPWVEERIFDPPLALLKTKKSKDHFFLSKESFCIVGSDDIYKELVKLPDFELSENSLIFLEEYPGMSAAHKDFPCTYLLYEKTEVDLIASFIDKSRYIFPASFLNYSPSTSSGSPNWWKRDASDFVWFRDFLQTKYGIDNQDFDYGGGWAISEGNYEFSISTFQFSEGDILLARVIRSKQAGKVEFWQSDKKIGEIDTLVEDPEKVAIKLTGYGKISDQYFEYEKAEFRWFEVGNLTGGNLKVKQDDEIIIKTEGNINIVNALAVVSRNELSHFDELISQSDIVRWDDLTDENKIVLFSEIEKGPTVRHEKLNSTHYKVEVKGVTNPVTLAFSETYDPLWMIAKTDSEKTPPGWLNRLSGAGTNEKQVHNSFPLYSLINGFVIEEDGEYDIYFEPQRYVLPGLVISAVTLVSIFTLLVLLQRKNITKHSL